MIEVPLTQGKVALIDDEDAERVLTHKWTYYYNPLNKREYARRNVKQRSIWLHRFIIDAPSGKQVDHINGNGLDNRRANLRLATNAQNHCNIPTRPDRVGFRGVTPSKRGSGYVARIKVDGKQINVGLFKTADEAARAYDVLAKHYHGEFATLNFPTKENYQ